MAVITWGNQKVSSFRWSKLRRDMVFTSIFGSQALEGGSPLWAVEMQGVPQVPAEAHQMVAFLESLEGYRNQLALWNLAQPFPAGTMRGSMTLSTAAAQGATSLTIAGAVSDVNLISNGTFDADVSGWSVGSNTAHASTFSASAGEAVLNATGSGGGRWGCPIQCTIGRTYIVTGTVRRVSGTGSGGIGVALTSALSIAGSSSTSNTTNTARSFSFVATQATHFIMCYASTQNDVFAFDNLSVCETQANKTLLAGDLLGLGSGLTQQVVRVTADATANGSGVIIVSIGTPLRNAFSGGAAVTWDRPKALFRQQSLNEGIEYQPGIGQPWSLSLVEDWRA